MKLPSSRAIFWLLFFGCCGLMGVGFYMQYQMGLEPCPLCMTQRVFIVLTGLIALLAALHYPGPRGQQIYAGAGILSALIGGSFSSRQLWLQHLPADQVPACGPSLEYILDTFEFSEALEIMLTGDGNCAEVVWSFLGISIPGWTLVAFAGLALFNVWLIFRAR